jgi:CheY-like chemotaxis protein
MPRALVVDDNADVRYLASCVLGLEGFDVLEAASGVEALGTLSDGGTPDVVLLDVQMPELDGWDTLAAIRREPSTGELPVLLWTVKASPQDAVRGWELGCDGYVVKPFSNRQLAEAVHAAIGRSPDERRRIRDAALAEARRLAEQRATG